MLSSIASLVPAVSSDLARLDRAAASSGPAVAPPLTPERQRELLAASRALESLFSRYLLAALGDKLPGLSSDGLGGGVYSDLYRSAVAEAAAERGSLGLSRMIYERLGGAPAAGPRSL